MGEVAAKQQREREQKRQTEPKMYDSSYLNVAALNSHCSRDSHFFGNFLSDHFDRLHSREKKTGTFIPCKYGSTHTHTHTHETRENCSRGHNFGLAQIQHDIELHGKFMNIQRRNTFIQISMSSDNM